MKIKLKEKNIDTKEKYIRKILNQLLFNKLLSKGQPSRFLIKEKYIPNKTQISALNQFQTKLENSYYSLEEVPCICGSNDSYLIAKRDRYGLSADTWLCKDCGLVRTSPRMNEESLSRFYNEDYRPIYVGEAQAPDHFFSTQIRQGKAIYNFVKSNSNLDLSSNITVFDVGCGAGGVLVPFKAAGCSTFGCDLGGEYLKRGITDGLSLKHGNVDSLRDYGEANLVILSHVIEHFPNPILELEQISKALVKEGYLYIEVPGIFNIHKTYGNTLNFLQNAHLYHFTLATLTSLMAKAGFKLIEGDEHIHALFQKCENVSHISTENLASKILNYLYLVELKSFFPSLIFRPNRIKKIFVRRVKYLLGDSLVNKLKQLLR